MWHNSNKTENINNVNHEKEKEEEKESLTNKNKYSLLKDYEEEDYYENI